MNDDDDDDDPSSLLLSSTQFSQEEEEKRTRTNFILMAVVFSANHGCTVSCLSLATSRLGGSIGAWQSGTLYITYTISALGATTYTTKMWGGRNAMMGGMALCKLCTTILESVYPIGWGDA
jgi:hypothetical protein